MKYAKHDNARQNRNKVIEDCKGNPQRQCPAYGKMYGGCSKANHFRVICKSAQRQWHGQMVLKSGRFIHEV